jgi:D-alanyl-D-alanine carboxypeptidase
MKKNILCLPICILLAGFFLSIDTAAAFDMSISAESAILIEAQTGYVLYEKNADAVMPMASTTKLMTALIASENCDLNSTVTIPKSVVGIEGSSIYLKENEKITIIELLYAALLNSGNDAAEALAYAASNGSRQTFISMMNDKAKNLGLVNTHFSNPSGLPEEGHYTTARELAIIAMAVSQNEILSEIVATEQITLENEDGYARYYSNHNSLLRMYDYADGMKTGYTKQAGRCLVSSATKDGIKLICVTLNAPDDWNDHINLLEYGFEHAKLSTLIDMGEISIDVPVGGGLKNLVTATNFSEISLPVFDDQNIYRFEYALPKLVFAPVKKGSVIGSINCYYGNLLVGQYPLAAEESIDTLPVITKYQKFCKLMDQILDFILI